MFATSLQNLSNISRKKRGMKLIYCADEHYSYRIMAFYKLIVLLLMGFARHAQITRLNLQYLCDILRKKSGMKLGT